MIDSVSQSGENLVINKGEGSAPSPPPSSAKSSSSDAAQPAVEVELNLSQEVTQQVGKASENARQLERVIENEVEKSAREKDLEQELDKTINALNDKLSRLDREVLFKVDKRTNRNYVSVIDKQSKEIIREFPPEEIRTFIARFEELNEKLSMSSDVKSLIINLEV